MYVSSSDFNKILHIKGHNCSLNLHSDSQQRLKTQTRADLEHVIEKKNGVAFLLLFSYLW